MESGNKAGIGASLLALLAGAAHFGDDLLRGLGRAAREAPPPGVTDDVARPVAMDHWAKPVADGATSTFQGPNIAAGANVSGQINVKFKTAVAASAAELAKSRPALVQFEIASGKLTIGSDRRLSRHVKVGHREINLYSTAAIAGTPLALCLANLETSSEFGLRRCVNMALNEMAGPPKAPRKL